MKSWIRAIAIAIAGVACNSESDQYEPKGVTCGDLLCGNGLVCRIYIDSCLAPEYSCIWDYEGCVVKDVEDADEFAACVDDGICEFDPKSDTLTCQEAGDAGC